MLLNQIKRQLAVTASPRAVCTRLASPQIIVASIPPWHLTGQISWLRLGQLATILVWTLAWKSHLSRLVLRLRHGGPPISLLWTPKHHYTTRAPALTSYIRHNHERALQRLSEKSLPIFSTPRTLKPFKRASTSNREFYQRGRMPWSYPPSE